MSLEDAIRAPGNPDHFMRVKPAASRIVVRRGGAVLADSRAALRVLEHGRDLYDPVLYIPLADVTATLTPNGRTTHCPLKGDTVYYDGAAVPNLAWEYARPRPGAAMLRGNVAFDGASVTICEGDA